MPCFPNRNKVPVEVAIFSFAHDSIITTIIFIVVVIMASNLPRNPREGSEHNIGSFVNSQSSALTAIDRKAEYQ